VIITHSLIIFTLNFLILNPEITFFEVGKSRKFCGLRAEAEGLAFALAVCEERAIQIKYA